MMVSVARPRTRAPALAGHMRKLTTTVAQSANCWTRTCAARPSLSSPCIPFPRSSQSSPSPPFQAPPVSVPYHTLRLAPASRSTIAATARARPNPRVGAALPAVVFVPRHHQSTSTSARVTMVAENFDAVLKGKYPAKDHAKRTLDLIRKEIPDANGLIYLEARHTKLLEDNDSPEPFRQRRFFYYLTGSNLADSFFTYDIQTSKSTLYIPPIEPDEVIWSGLPVSAEEALAQYEVDEVKYTTDVNSVISSYATANPNSTLFAIEGQVSDHIKISDFQNQNLTLLKKSIEVARVVKDEYEVAIIRKANYVSALAHKAVIEKSRTAKNERELLAVFLATCLENGAVEMAYHPILASGEAAATLHYVDNNRTLENKTNLLIDAGAEWNNYASDVTRTFPLTGKFTPESRAIYDIVLKMQQDTMAQIKAGASWDDIHVVAHKVAIDGLLSIGILKGDKQEIFDARTSCAFFPHGLGHHLGLDTHDTGGNPNPKDKDVMFRYLRLRGTLPAGSVVTVEPGVYFCRFIIEPYLKDPKHSKFIDTEVLDKYWSVGGVRIEDNVFVTETGYENLTTTVKEVDEVEAITLG